MFSKTGKRNISWFAIWFEFGGDQERLVRRVCRVEEEIKMQMKKVMRITGLCCVSALLVACGQTVGTDKIDVTAATVHAQENVLEQKNKENNAAATWNDSELEEWKQV